jgi:hypothetical protein
MMVTTPKHVDHETYPRLNTVLRKSDTYTPFVSSTRYVSLTKHIKSKLNYGFVYKIFLPVVKYILYITRWAICYEAFFFPLCNISWARVSLLTRLNDHTQTQNTCRTPPNETGAKRRDLEMITHNNDKRQTSMPLSGFEPAVPRKRSAVDPRINLI